MEIRRVEDLETFSTEQPVRVTVADGPRCRVTLWCLEPGQQIRPHAHAGDHVWTVQKGEGWFLAGEGDEHPVATGSVIVAPAGEVHGMRAATRLVFVSVSEG